MGVLESQRGDVGGKEEVLEKWKGRERSALFLTHGIGFGKEASTAGFLISPQCREPALLRLLSNPRPSPILFYQHISGCCNRGIRI